MLLLERVRPLLGTLVSIRVAGLGPEDRLLAAVDAAFAMIAHVHDRMSFQSFDSVVSAIGRLRRGERCELDEETRKCLGEALRLAARSDGVFDPVLPGSGACWRDLGLDGAVASVDKPLRLDLSGIAKGHAVDRACDMLRDHDIDTAIVNAGGDLRTFGVGELVALTPRHPAPSAAVTVEDGALASSDVAGAIDEYGEARHRDGRTGAATVAAFASVAAPRCVHADALTKVVLALGDEASPLLGHYDAHAYVHRPGGDWLTIEGRR